MKGACDFALCIFNASTCTRERAQPSLRRSKNGTRHLDCEAMTDAIYCTLHAYFIP